MRKRCSRVDSYQELIETLVGWCGNRSLRACGEEIGVGRSTIMYWKRGDIKPSKHTIPALAAKLNLNEADVRRVCGR